MLLAGRTVTIRFAGDVDFTRRDEIAEQFACAEHAKIVILDLRDVPYVDSTFLGEVARLYKRMSGGIRPFAVRLVGVRSELRRIFEIANFDEILEFYDSLDAAELAPL